jgi:hypothetical protein
MKRILLTVALASVTVHSAANGTEDPMRWHHGGMTVILHNGNKEFTSVAGDTPLDAARNVTCEGTRGCLISFAGHLIANNNAKTALEICALVDGQDLAPGCFPSWQNLPSDNRQSGKVTQGQHTVQTIIRDTSGGATVSAWEGDLTIYEKGN